MTQSSAEGGGGKGGAVADTLSRLQTDTIFHISSQVT